LVLLPVKASEGCGDCHKASGEDSALAIRQESAKFRPDPDISVSQIQVPFLEIMKRMPNLVRSDHNWNNGFSGTEPFKTDDFLLFMPIIPLFLPC